MAKEKGPIQDALTEAARIQNDPVAPLIAKLGEAVETSISLVESEMAANKTESEKAIVDVRKLVESTRTELATGLKVHADRINTLDRRSVALGLSGPRDIEGLALAALGDEERRDIKLMSWSMPSDVRKRHDDLPLLSNPSSATLVAHWLYASFKVQRRRFSTQKEESELYTRMERYEKAFKEMFPHETAAALDSTGDSGVGLGGAWLPEPVAAELYRLITDNSVISSQATHVPMSAKQLDLPTEGSSSLTVDWGSENTDVTDSVPASAATNIVSLKAARLQGFAASSLEEMQDSAISILSWVQTKLTELAGREIDRVFLEGLIGTAPLVAGLFANAGVKEITAGANGDLITYAAIAAIPFKARERASRDGAKWYTSPEVMGKIIGLVDTTGQPIVQFANVPGQFAASLLGFPVEIHSVIKADRTYGTGTSLSSLYFGPPKQFIVGDRMGMSWDVSDIPQFRKAQVNMRLITRVGLGIAVPGAFARKTAISIA